jgi:hypothetical protein
LSHFGHPSFFQDKTLMEAEHINAISNQLADLSLRVNELRGYL